MITILQTQSIPFDLPSLAKPSPLTSPAAPALFFPPRVSQWLDSFHPRKHISGTARQRPERKIQAMAVLSEADVLAPITIYTVDGRPVKFQDMWNQNQEKAVVAFLRHFGCPLCWDFAVSLRDTKPKLDAAGVKLIVVGVGTFDKAQILAERMPFPKDCLYADPERKAYNALGLYYGVGRTFFNPASAQVLGRLDTIQKALKGYTASATPNEQSSVLQQGGLYVFEGKKLLYFRKDEGTGDHAPLDEVLRVCCSMMAG